MLLKTPRGIAPAVPKSRLPLPKKDISMNDVSMIVFEKGAESCLAQQEQHAAVDDPETCRVQHACGADGDEHKVLTGLCR